jgi:hypothetical protein
MDEVARLTAIEAIKRLKAKYFYYLDHQDWEGWKREVFASDASLFVPDISPEPIIGVDAIIAWTSSRADGQVSVHHGHMPDIEIHNADTASGVWAMEDLLFKTEEQARRLGYSYLHGFGHYHETYARGPAGWRIRSTKLTRLHVEKRLSPSDTPASPRA